MFDLFVFLTECSSRKPLKRSYKMGDSLFNTEKKGKGSCKIRSIWSSLSSWSWQCLDIQEKSNFPWWYPSIYSLFSLTMHLQSNIDSIHIYHINIIIVNDGNADLIVYKVFYFPSGRGQKINIKIVFCMSWNITTTPAN